MRQLEEIKKEEIKNYVRTEFETFSPNDKVSRVVGELTQHQHYEALVVEGEKIGLVTVRDLLDVVQPDQTSIGNYPNTRWNVYPTVSVNQNIGEVVKLLVKNRVRALPVIDRGVAIGCISQVELIGALKDCAELKNIEIKQLMHRDVKVALFSEKISSARSMMLQNNFSHLPVIKNGQLVGMVTAKEIATTFTTSIGRTTTGERVGKSIPRFEGTVENIADKRPLVAQPEDSVSEVVNKMLEFKKSSSLIVVNEEIVGIVTPREILSIVKRDEEVKLPIYIIGLPDDVDFVDRSVIENKIMRVSERALKMHPDISEIFVNVKSRNAGGNRNRWEVSLNTYSHSGGEQFNLGKEGWDLAEVVDEVADSLDRLFRKTKRKPKRMAADDKLRRNLLVRKTN